MCAYWCGFYQRTGGLGVGHEKSWKRTLMFTKLQNKFGSLRENLIKSEI